MQSKIIVWALALCSCLFLDARSRAAVILSVEQAGSNVDVIGSGSADVAGLSATASGSDAASMIPNPPALVVGSPAFSEITSYGYIAGPQSLGSSDQFTEASSGTGQLFGLDDYSPTQLLIDVPYGYVSGSPLAGTSEYANTTIAALGLTTGTYTYTWGSGATADSMTLFIGVPASVPEPSSLFVGVAAAVLGSRRWRSRAGAALAM